MHPFKLQLLLWVNSHVVKIYLNVQVFIQNCIYKPFTKPKVGEQSTGIFCFIHNIITYCKINTTARRIWNWIWQGGALHVTKKSGNVLANAAWQLSSQVRCAYNVELWKTTKQGSRNLLKFCLYSKVHNKTPFQWSMNPKRNTLDIIMVKIPSNIDYMHSWFLQPIWQYFIHTVSSPYFTKGASGIEICF